MSKKLLLADDSITIQKVIGITFANEDVTLAIADNGDTALDMARAEPPDLLLADVLMPGLNGYELCEAIKSEPGLADIPVLLLTGTFEPFEEDKARAAGADDWIAKPFESQALIDRVQSLLGLTPDKLARPASATKVPQADMWRENPAEQPPPSEESVLAGEAEAVDADESLWADFTLDEEDMSGDGAPVPDEGAPFSEAQSDEDEGILDLDEEDILDLDEGDILEEDETLSSATEGDFADVSTQPDEEVEERPAVVDDWFSSEVSQEETETVPEPGFVADDAIQEEIPTEWRGLASSVAEPVSSSPAVFELSPESERITEASVAASTGLSEEAIEAVVERVAGEVVNRLAGTILEKIAWDVVPDLAESLIKDEIRKIKEALK